MHEPATAASCRDNALREAHSSAEYAAAMWAACALMALHDPTHRLFLQEHANLWAFYTTSDERAPGWR